MSYAQPIGEWEMDAVWIPPTAIGIVVAKNFPDEELLRSKLREGIAKKGNTVTWVMRERDSEGHAARWAWDEFRNHSIEPVEAVTGKFWGPGTRGAWRDREMLNLCERVIVFHDIGSGVTNSFVTDQYHVARVFVIERGEAKKRQRKGRAVV